MENKPHTKSIEVCNHDTPLDSECTSCLQEKVHKPQTISWGKQFDELFCRLDKSPQQRGYMDAWFLQEQVTGKEVKKFIQELLHSIEREIAAETLTGDWTPIEIEAALAMQSQILKLLSRYLPKEDVGEL